MIKEMERGVEKLRSTTQEEFFTKAMLDLAREKMGDKSFKKVFSVFKKIVELRGE